jgi:hypothetical protein
MKLTAQQEPHRRWTGLGVAETGYLVRLGIGRQPGRQRTLAQVVARTLNHQGHQVDALRAALA